MQTQVPYVPRVPHMPTVAEIMRAKAVVKTLQGRGYIKVLIHKLFPEQTDCSRVRLILDGIGGQEEQDWVNSEVAEAIRETKANPETFMVALRRAIKDQKL